MKEFDPDDAQAGLKQKGPPIQIPEEPAAALFSETVAGAAVEGMYSCDREGEFIRQQHL